MRVGVLDVGSNTARLLVADVDAGGVEPVATARAYLGLGAEIADTGTLRPKTISAAARACRKYADRARELGVERAQVIVTAPGRQGAASVELVAALRERTRLPVRILDAEDEGRLAFDGAVAHIVDAPSWSASSTSAAARRRSSSAFPKPSRHGYARSTSARSA